MAKIDIDNLVFEYEAGVPVLKGLTLDFDGRSTAIIGQNGTGKSTLVKIMKGLLKPTAGTVLIEGQDVATTSVATLAKTIGMVFQNPNDQIFKSTVIDEIMFGALKIGKSKDEARDLAIKAMTPFGLNAVADANPYDLTLAQRKQITIASIIAMDPDIIILDEPTIGQDAHDKKVLQTVIRDLVASGKQVITIAHDMDFVATTFERIIIMKKGEILLDGDVHTVFADQATVESAYLELPSVAQLARELGLPAAYTVDEFVVNYQK
jgi:energy-coupling factor transport system ATP-binding protein